MNAGNINYQITVNAAGALSAFKNVQSAMFGMGQAGQGLLQMGASFAMISAPLLAAAKAGLQFNSSLEQAGIFYRGFLGSAEKANQLLEDMKKMAEETPFELPDLLTGTKRLLAFGFSAEALLPVLRVIGDTAAGLGLSGADGINRLGLAIGQMKAKGKVSGEEMRQLAEAGVGAWEILAKGLGKTTAETMALSEKGIIPADKAIRILLEGMSKKPEEGGFFGMMKEMSKSFQGLFSTLKDNVNYVLGGFMLPIFNKFKNEVFPKLITLTKNLGEWFRSLSEESVKLYSYIALVLAVAGPLGIAIGGLVVAIGMLLSPIGLVVMAIIGLAATFVWYWNKSEEFRGKVAETWNSVVLIVQKALSTMIQIWNSYGAPLLEFMVKNWKVFLGIFTPIINMLVEIWQDFVGSFKTSGTEWAELFKSLWDLVGPILKIMGMGFWTVGLGIVSVFNGIAKAIGPAIDFIVKSVTAVSHSIGFLFDLITGNKSFDELAASAKQITGELMGLGKVFTTDAVAMFEGLVSGSVSGAEKYGKMSAEVYLAFDKASTVSKEMLDKMKSTPLDTSGGLDLSKYTVNVDQMKKGLFAMKDITTTLTDSLKLPDQLFKGSLGGEGELPSRGRKAKSTLESLQDKVVAFIDSIKEAGRKFADFVGMFDKLERNGPRSTGTIMRRMEKQLKEMQKWQESLKTIEAKGGSTEFIEQLKALGPGATRSIAGLAKGSPEQIARAMTIQQEKLRIGIGAAEATAIGQEARRLTIGQMVVNITGNKIDEKVDLDTLAAKVAQSITKKLGYNGI